MIFKFFNFIYNCIGSLIPFYEPFANDKLKDFKSLTFHLVSISVRDNTGKKLLKRDCKNVMKLFRNKSVKVKQLPSCYMIPAFAHDQEFAHSLVHNWDQLYEKFSRGTDSNTWRDNFHEFVCINLSGIDIETINLKFPSFNIDIEEVTDGTKYRMYCQICCTEKYHYLVNKYISDDGLECGECGSGAFSIESKCIRCHTVENKYKKALENKVYKNYLKAS